MKTREDILSQALNECIEEMFKWAQPSIDIKALLINNYIEDKEHPLYSIHYLSQENFEYIKNRYMKMYGIVDDWDDTFNCIYHQLEHGGTEDNYIPRNGDQPGYRDYKKVDPLIKHLKSPEDFKTIIEYIKKIQNFFKGHCRETNKFNFSIYMGCSPTTNVKEVEEYWKNNGRPNFKIKDFKIEDVIYGGVNDEYVNITNEEFINTLK